MEAESEQLYGDNVVLRNMVEVSPASSPCSYSPVDSLIIRLVIRVLPHYILIISQTFKSFKGVSLN